MLPLACLSIGHGAFLCFLFHLSFCLVIALKISYKVCITLVLCLTLQPHLLPFLSCILHFSIPGLGTCCLPPPTSPGQEHSSPRSLHLAHSLLIPYIFTGMQALQEAFSGLWRGSISQRLSYFIVIISLAVTHFHQAISFVKIWFIAIPSQSLMCTCNYSLTVKWVFELVNEAPSILWHVYWFLFFFCLLMYKNWDNYISHNYFTELWGLSEVMYIKWLIHKWLRDILECLYLLLSFLH